MLNKDFKHIFTFQNSSDSCYFEECLENNNAIGLIN